VSEDRKGGEICETCLPRWEARKLPAKVLVELPTTTELGLKLVACPYCDGPTVQLALNPDNKFLPEPDEDE